MDSEILSATLPQDADIRDTLLSELRKRFGERLVVLNGDVFVLPESENGNDVEIGEESAQILAGAGLRVENGESIAFAGTNPEKRLSRGSGYPRERKCFSRTSPLHGRIAGNKNAAGTRIKIHKWRTQD